MPGTAPIIRKMFLIESFLNDNDERERGSYENNRGLFGEPGLSAGLSGWRSW